MKKIISSFFLIVLLISALTVFSGCGGGRYELVLVTDTGNVTDKSFNQSAWDAMTEFAISRDLDCRYFIPQSKKTDDLTKQLRAAAKDGASVIIVCGKCFEEAVYTVQSEYPSVKFVIVDGRPHAENSNEPVIPSNTTSVMFAAEQSGFLAGYSAVYDEMNVLGFIGGIPDESTQAYGYGFLQGAEYAAKQSGIKVDVTYHYTKNTEKSDKNKQTAKDIYDTADVIFVCGEGVTDSVIEAAGEKRSYVICADKDRRYDSGAVLTSAVKGVSDAVKLVLKSVYDSKDFEYSFGGKSTYFDAANGGAGLASFVINDKNGDAFDRFYKFRKAEYDDILEKLSSKSITVKRSISVSDPSGYATSEELTSGLGLEFVTVSVLQ